MCRPPFLIFFARPRVPFPLFRTRSPCHTHTHSAEATRSFKAHDGPVLAMAFDPSSTLLATAAADSGVKVWDALKGYCTHYFKGSSGVVSTVVFHPTRLELFSCATEGHVRWWDLASSKPLGVLKGHNSVVRGVQLVNSTGTGSGGELMLTGGRDQVVLVWNLARKKIIKTIPVYEAVEAVVVLPKSIELEVLSDDSSDDEFYFVTAGDAAALRVWGYPSVSTAVYGAPPRPIHHCMECPFCFGAMIAATARRDSQVGELRHVIRHRCA